MSKRSLQIAGGLLVGISLTAAACGSDSSTAKPAAGVSTTAAPAASAAPTTTVKSAATNAGAVFGPACASVPKDGAGSLAGMAKDPAATAASNNPLLSTLVATLKAAGLVDTLNGPGPFTIFAPSNDAFAKIDKATIDKLLADPKGDLTKILTLHVVGGQKLDAEGLLKAGKLKTVNGADVSITKTGDTYMVNGAKVLCGNVQTANATVFIIDSVLVQ